MVPLIILCVIIATSCSVGGQLSLKKGMNNIAAKPGGSLVLRIVFSPWVIVGMAIYVAGVVFWLMALSRLQVGYLYPFASLSYVGISIGSHLIFKEPLSRIRLAGISVIVLGVCIAGLSIH